jgi:hypothetical protein
VVGVTTLVRAPRLTVPVIAAPVTTEAQARLADALELAADIRAAGAAALRVHDLAPRG